MPLGNLYRWAEQLISVKYGVWCVALIGIRNTIHFPIDSTYAIDWVSTFNHQGTPSQIFFTVACRDGENKFQ